MVRDTLETIDELLEGVMNDVDDSDVRYRLRSARQLLELAKQRYKGHDEAIEDIVEDDEILKDLRELGYVE
ncbi:hypothetical protein halTADL_1448 [Halohasta litchfieldiae]|jgi:hypothetical protein|uniref:Uncharacterized protein n=1 Tax=Halohasta litchfieldiae TaxID=1073996 RepID=A0A1H6XT70_9EURY|nr:hypothetical protein [Halohasta litchfieldiae]ATW88216.1 hypothetical protein halTADL_1448 [Halohasta litchfieldiae]SEJ32239.1 hypothetical protein SAMN05444271_1476 [Halohasta litchfieldiae]